MDKRITEELLNNPKLLNHLMEQSYYIKDLNRSYYNFNKFKNDVKIIYKERVSDKINNAIDSVEMISDVIDTIK